MTFPDDLLSLAAVVGTIALIATGLKLAPKGRLEDAVAEAREWRRIAERQAEDQARVVALELARENRRPVQVGCTCEHCGLSEPILEPGRRVPGWARGFVCVCGEPPPLPPGDDPRAGDPIPSLYAADLFRTPIRRTDRTHTGCSHSGAVDVESVVDGEILARFCPDCETQLEVEGAP